METSKNCNPGKFNGSEDVHGGANITQVASDNGRVIGDKGQGRMEGIQKKELRLYEKLNLGPLNMANLDMQELHYTGCPNARMILGNSLIENALTKKKTSNKLN